MELEKCLYESCLLPGTQLLLGAPPGLPWAQGCSQQIQALVPGCAAAELSGSTVQQPQSSWPIATNVPDVPTHPPPQFQSMRNNLAKGVISDIASSELVTTTLKVTDFHSYWNKWGRPCRHVLTWQAADQLAGWSEKAFCPRAASDCCPSCSSSLKSSRDR